MRKIRLLICMAGIMSFDAIADVYVDEYEKTRDADFMKAYVAGVAIGAVNANYMLNAKSKLFCFPQGIAFSQNLWLGILDSEIDKITKRDRSLFKGLTIEPLLTLGMQKHYPCKR